MELPDKILQHLSHLIEGELLTDNSAKISYATDASVYYERPVAVAIPKNVSDIEKLVVFASENNFPLIPRAGGTSLAGQVVGNGLVVDVSKYLTEIIEVNEQEKWVRVQPGVILDELNRKLADKGLFFGPETSTANRCTLGGMVGNNACGLHAVVYGTTRDHILEVSGFLSDRSKVTFGPLLKPEFEVKCKSETLEGNIYKYLNNILSDTGNRQSIIENFPDPGLIRRNHGYAIDQLLDTDPFTGNGKPFNFSKLIAGSEGTLMFITEIKLNLVDLPLREKVLVCAHFNSVNEALKANIVALKHQVTAVELMDDIILNASKGNIDQQKNRFFVKDEPKAILMIELVHESKDQVLANAELLINDLKTNGLGFHFPLLYGDDTRKAWNLRKAGLGIMANIPGDKVSVTVIEDTAVHTDVLPGYIEEFSRIMEKFGEDCVYHAHAGTGEIHLRPRLNLKQQGDIDKFENLGWEIAHLVKKYRGSLSGEHGDGRLRGQFIPFMLGDRVYQLLVSLKQVCDPLNIFNPGKIINTPNMRDNLRYASGETRQIETVFDFSDKLGIVRAAESCNGSGDCRKLHTAGGTMCPSYMATRDERHVTRSRANILREFLTGSQTKNPFDHKEIYEALDLCLSCKACKSECPGSVDIAKLKAEFLQHWYDAHGIPLRSRLIANISKINKMGSVLPQLTNFIITKGLVSVSLKKMLGFATERSLPIIQPTPLRQWIKSNSLKLKEKNYKGEVVLFIDEFTNYNDTHIGITTIRLLSHLGYKVNVTKHAESGRAYLSKGLLRKARSLAINNVLLLSDIVSDQKPLIGIEPSAILTFRDEYPDLVGSDLKNKALTLAKNTFLVDEFISREIEAGQIDSALFTKKEAEIILHGHCQQKAVASTQSIIKMLTLPENYSIKEIPSGCCGMAGSFGFEKEHYEVSMKIGELVLFPAVREADPETIVVASGTSCRHQVKDGTGRQALHPVEVLFQALM